MAVGAQTGANTSQASQLRTAVSCQQQLGGWAVWSIKNIWPNLTEVMALGCTLWLVMTLNDKMAHTEYLKSLEQNTPKILTAIIYEWQFSSCSYSLKCPHS